MKPQLGLFKEIDSFCSLRHFPLRNYKHLSRFKIAKPEREIAQDKNILRAIKHSASFKSLKHLDFSKYRLENFSLSQVKLIAKKFHKIIRLSLFEAKKCTENFYLSTIMLKEAKSLRHLCIKGTFDHFPERLLRFIRLSKLKTFNLVPMNSGKYEPGLVLDFSKYYPSTLEKLSLFGEKQMKTELNEDLLLSHLHNLQNLILGMPIPGDTFQKITKSLADPSKLKSLQFHIEGYQPDVEKFLSRCFNLEELNVKTEMDIYPEANKRNPNVKMMKLKRLSIEQNVESTRELLKLENFIQQQKNSLESLDLASRLWHPSMKIWALKFLEDLKSLKKLKRLKLKFNILGMNVQSLLVELVETLEELEEIDFSELAVEFKASEFKNYWKVLGKRNLKSLKVSLSNFKMIPNNSNLLLQTLMSLNRLESLTLKDFEIEDPNFYNELRELICCKNKRLNEVTLENVKREKTEGFCENLLEMLKEIIKKPTMKRFCYLEISGCGFSSDFKDLEILSLSEDVMTEIYHFDYLQIPSYTCEPTFYSWNIDFQKWEDRFGREDFEMIGN